MNRAVWLDFQFCIASPEGSRKQFGCRVAQGMFIRFTKVAMMHKQGTVSALGIFFGWHAPNQHYSKHYPRHP